MSVKQRQVVFYFHFQQHFKSRHSPKQTLYMIKRIETRRFLSAATYSTCMRRYFPQKIGLVFANSTMFLQLAQYFCKQYHFFQIAPCFSKLYHVFFKKYHVFAKSFMFLQNENLKISRENYLADPEIEIRFGFIRQNYIANF